MKRILIIDDDPVTQEVICETLEPEGFELMRASNGIEGLKLHEENPADLVITDLVMPEMEGLETIQQLKTISPELKIIAISGGGTIVKSKYLHIADKVGANLSFSKPLELPKLKKGVKDLLNL